MPSNVAMTSSAPILRAASRVPINGSANIVARTMKSRGWCANAVPFYHFDLVNTKRVAEGGAELSDDIEAIDSADLLARRLLDSAPDLRNWHCSILVTNEEGEEICRLPLDIIHRRANNEAFQSRHRQKQDG